MQNIQTADKEVKFLFIGRVIKIKGIEEFLKAAETVKSRRTAAAFHLAGSVDQKEYQSLIDEHEQKGTIRFWGFQKDIESIIKKSHCIILPSHGGEGVPNALLESAAIGRPVIASDIPGSRDVIEEGVNGYLFRPKDAADLVRKIEAFLALSKDERAAMGKAGRRKVEREFDRNIIVKAYLERIRALTGA